MLHVIPIFLIGLSQRALNIIDLLWIDFTPTDIIARSTSRNEFHFALSVNIHIVCKFFNGLQSIQNVVLTSESWSWKISSISNQICCSVLKRVLMLTSIINTKVITLYSVIDTKQFQCVSINPRQFTHADSPVEFFIYILETVVRNADFLLAIGVVQLCNQTWLWTTSLTVNKLHH